MNIFEAQKSEMKKVQDWNSFDRIERLTCRPVVNGVPVRPEDSPFHFLFYSDNIEEPIGNLFYFDVNPRNSSCEFGYKINPKFRNMGFGKEMLQNFISHAFDVLNFNKIYCQTAAFNEPSLRLLQSLGFKLDAVLREHHELDGVFFDDFIYSMLKSDRT